MNFISKHYEKKIEVQYHFLPRAWIDMCSTANWVSYTQLKILLQVVVEILPSTPQGLDFSMESCQAP